MTLRRRRRLWNLLIILMVLLFVLGRRSRCLCCRLAGWFSFLDRRLRRDAGGYGYRIPRLLWPPLAARPQPLLITLQPPLIPTQPHRHSPNSGSLQIGSGQNTTLVVHLSKTGPAPSKRHKLASSSGTGGVVSSPGCTSVIKIWAILAILADFGFPGQGGG